MQGAGNSAKNSVEEGRRLCCHGDDCGSCGGGSVVAPAGPFTPRFNGYRFTLPSAPVVHATGRIYRPSKNYHAAHDKDFGDPIGVAVSGVLIFGVHHKFDQDLETIQKVPLKRSFDACGGHGDRNGRYHYHGAPICLMQKMFMPIPDTGAEFLRDKNASMAISRWPATSVPSPILGFALDGFPIYGPYNSTGHLMIARNGTGANLDSCNFHIATQRYYFSPNFPYGPTCLRGEVIGTYSNEKPPAGHLGTCPKAGVDVRVCIGDHCEPVNSECDPTYVAFQTDTIWKAVLFSGILVLLFVCYSIMDVLWRGDETPYPMRISAISVMPAFVVLLNVQVLLWAFYGESDDFSYNITKVEKFLNDAVNTYLAVVGVIYSLVVAHLLTIASDKSKRVSEDFIAEMTAVRQTVLLLRSMQFTDATVNRAEEIQIEAVMILQGYITALLLHWGRTKTTRNSLDMLYGVLPCVGHLTMIENEGNFNSVIADRIVDTVNDVSKHHSSRVSAETVHVPAILWLLNIVLSTAMFFGIALIFSGSYIFNLMLCTIAGALIGISTHAIADLDSPYLGNIQVDKGSLIDIDQYIEHVLANSHEYFGKHSHKRADHYKQTRVKLAAGRVKYLQSFQRKRFVEKLADSIPLIRAFSSTEKKTTIKSAVNKIMIAKRLTTAGKLKSDPGIINRMSGQISSRYFGNEVSHSPPSQLPSPTAKPEFAIPAFAAAQPSMPKVVPAGIGAVTGNVMDLNAIRHTLEMEGEARLPSDHKRNTSDAWASVIFADEEEDSDYDF
jgi:hypothetical protein